jgi:hypothetical protein
MATAQSFQAEILRIEEEVFTKSNGNQYMRCEVSFKSGPLTGKSYFAQRTLGDNKASISVGQNVACILNVVTDKDGVKRPFFEISTSRVDSAESILDALGM